MKEKQDGNIKSFGFNPKKYGLVLILESSKDFKELKTVNPNMEIILSDEQNPFGKFVVCGIRTEVNMKEKPINEQIEEMRSDSETISKMLDEIKRNNQKTENLNISSMFLSGIALGLSLAVLILKITSVI